MPKNNNSAFRIYKIMENVAATSNDRRMIDVWAEVLSVKQENTPKRNYEIVRKLGLLHDELQNARRAMQTTDFSVDLYERAFSHSEAVMQVEGLTNQINGYRGYLSPEYFVSLKFCAELLPHEEDAVDNDELSQLLNEVNELAQKIDNGELPQFVKEFVLRQISYIRQAISDYSIVGAKAFKQALDKSFVDCIENEAIVKEYKESEAIGALAKIWQSAIRYGGPVIKYGGYIASGVKLIEAGIKIAEHLH